jgi:hypothetical protein
MRKWMLVLLLLYIQGQAFSQIQFTPGSNPGFGKRVYFGGSFGLQLGSVTYIDVSPLAGYMITRNLSAGLGVTYRYYKDNYVDYHTNIYGGRLFVRHNVTFMRLPLFLYSEYENLSFEFASFNPATQDYDLIREWVPSLFIGGGLFQPIGNRAGFTIMALYNMLWDAQKSPYNSAWVFRVGFTL